MVKGGLELGKSIIDINSSMIECIEDENNTIVIKFKNYEQLFYTGSDKTRNVFEVDLKDVAKLSSTAHVSSTTSPTLADPMESVLNESLDKLKGTKIALGEPSKMTLTIDKIDGNKIILSLMIVNNTEHILSFANIPYKIMDNSGETIYKSQLSDKYEVESKAFSIYKIQIEESNEFQIPQDGYQIIFSN
jgi:hypothetical protein